MNKKIKCPLCKKDRIGKVDVVCNRNGVYIDGYITTSYACLMCGIIFIDKLAEKN